MNIAQCAREIGLDESDYRELLALFVQTTRTDLMTLAAAVASGDAERAFFSSHSIKGAAANLGLTEISAAALEIERKSREGRPSDARDSAAAIARRLGEIADVLAGGETPGSRSRADDSREPAPSGGGIERRTKE